MGKVSDYPQVTLVGRVVASGLFHLRKNVFGQKVSLFDVTVLGKQAACLLRKI